MKSILTVFILFVGVAMNLPAQEAAGKIIGLWSNEDHTAQNQIYQNSDTYEAKIVKGKAYVGTVTLYNLKFDGKVWKGKAFQPKTGRTADVILTLRDDDTLELTATKAGFSRTKNWRRVKE